ncbi:MAG TPA: hypothetical protein VE986_01450 [Hyphomicrobiales bacterium]|nr:hypothetical protein [Hyphomicrobiales bacterium]
MIRWLLRRPIQGFERTWNYDASYLHGILDADPRALWIFSKMQGIGQYRKDVPLAAYYAARITGTMAEDCGPCTQLAVDMAERAGVDPGVLRAVIARDFSAMPADAALAVRFTEATLRHAPDADGLREEILRRWGKRALISLAFGIAAARIFPTVKYALGHGRACMRVRVGNDVQPVERKLSQAA